MKTFTRKIQKLIRSLFFKKKNSSQNKQNNEEQLFLKFNQKSKIPSFKQLKHISKSLSKKELLLIKLLLAIIILTAIFSATFYFFKESNVIPAQGGQYTEGVLGQPQYINPIYSQTSDVDNDITTLVYSGLLKYDNNLQLVPNLAQKFEISIDNLEYTFYLRDDVYWHDGGKFNSDDVINTIESILDPEYNSPLFLSLKGVEYEKIDNYTIKFKLRKPFSPFPAVLTFGILPCHIWNNIEASTARLAEYNLKPIGTGPWKFKSLTKNKKGEIQSYTVEKNDNYYGTKPFLDSVSFKFFANFDDLIVALENKKIQGINFIPQKLKENVKKLKQVTIHALTFPQYTAIFLNQDKNDNLKNKNVREALKLSIQKQKIVDYALDGEGTPIAGPILRGFVGYSEDIEVETFNRDKANELLDKAGYKKTPGNEYFEKEKQKMIDEYREKAKDTNDVAKNSDSSDAETDQDLSDEEITEKLDLSAIDSRDQEFVRIKDKELLTIKLTTVDHPENKKAGQLIKDYWQKIGVKVILELIDPITIQKETIKKRNYEALIYGQNIGSDPDPYSFWHSSQTSDPGLNLAMFSNKKADDLIVESRETTDKKIREDNYFEFQKILSEEVPAIFLYSPTYTYILSQKIKGFNINSIIDPSDRFNNIDQWHIKTKRIIIKDE